MVKLNRMDLKAERDGIDVSYDPQPGIVVRLARMRNPAMVAWMNGPSGQDRLRELKLTMTPEEARDRWFREAVARFVTLGWTGMDEAYDPDLAVTLMTDPRYYPWQDWVAEKSDDLTRFIEADKSSAEKNSEPA